MNKNTIAGSNSPDWDEIDPDGSSSRLTMNNRPRSAKGLVNPEIELKPNELPQQNRFDRISVEPERKLRDECVHITQQNETQSRPLVDVVNEWRDWYRSYENSNMEFESPDGETVRAPLRNSYQPEYGEEYYAKIKDLERAAERQYDGVTTVMLTFTASHLNANGQPRCIADHMRDVQTGYNAARKRLHDELSEYRWEYARVWEPHKDGYGHQHMAIFILDGPEVSESDFEPVMRSHVRNCKPAGWEAHKPSGDSVSLSESDEIDNLGSYVSEYIGIFGESPLERPIEEQIFNATAWATDTQKVTFSNGAHKLMKTEQFRRESGLKPKESDAENVDGNASEWEIKSICTVNGRTPHYSDPTSGGVDMTAIDGSDTLDPPPDRE